MLSGIAVLAAIVLAVIRVGLWTPGSAGVAAWVTLVGAAAGGSSGLWSAIDEARRGREAKDKSELDGLVEALKWAVDKDVGISPFDLGITVWKPQRRPLVDRLLRRNTPRRLKPSYRQRSRNRHSSSGIEWTEAKGTIGLCIRDGDMVHADLGELWEPLRGCTSQEWNGQSEDVRQGLTHAEFTKALKSSASVLGGHLIYVLAVPILSAKGGEVLGCVALDAPSGFADRLSMGTPLENLRQIADFLGRQ
ncbi:hypothetical protein [Geodermatophilus sp. SYSU D00684]